MFRYLDLVRKYVVMTDKLALNPQYKKPIMPEYEYYFRQHHTPGKDYCYDAWMQYSKPLYHLAKLMMRSLKIEETILYHVHFLPVNSTKLPVTLI